MKFSAGQIAQILGGKIEGDEHAEVDKLAKIEEGEVGSLTFLANPAYASYIYSTKASIVIVQEDFKAEKEINKGTTLIRVPDAYSSFGKLLEMYDTAKHSRTGIEKNANVSDSAKLGENIYIGSGTYIGENVKIGNNTKIYPNCFLGDNAVVGDNCIIHAGVKIYLDCRVGSDCIIHSGVVIGGDGFGFSPNSENNYAKVPQIGNVIIEDHVEIGSNSAIDRATMGSTVIRKGVKLDNLVQIAHNVEIGENCVLAAQTGVAGSTKMGKNCMVGGQVGIVGHIKIGENVKIAAQSGVIADVGDNEIVQGAPAFKYTDYNRSYVLFRSLPKVIQRFNAIEKAFKEKFDRKE